MRNDKTVRQRIKGLLEVRPSATPTDVSNALSDYGIRLSPEDIIDEIAEIDRSLNADKQIFVRPAECRDCGFDDWDNKLNIPSTCPEKDCRSEWIREPAFKIQTSTG